MRCVFHPDIIPLCVSIRVALDVRNLAERVTTRLHQRPAFSRIGQGFWRLESGIDVRRGRVLRARRDLPVRFPPPRVAFV